MKKSAIEKKHQFATDHKTTCKCGHTMVIYSKDGKMICRWCKRWCFVNEEAEKKYREKELINKLKGELL